MPLEDNVFTKKICMHTQQKKENILKRQVWQQPTGFLNYFLQQEKPAKGMTAVERAYRPSRYM